MRDRSPTELRREIGYVIQQIGLFPHQTVADNIATVPRLLGWDKARTAAARRASCSSWSGSTPARSRRRYPAQLSGGQRQRVGVARALAADPPLMLMDEPFGAIDPITRERLQDEFLRLQERVRKTVVFVTHDIDEAIKMGDTIAILRQGGHLAQYGTPDEILARPADEFVAEFVGADRALKRLLAGRAVADVDLEPDCARRREPSSGARGPPCATRCRSCSPHGGAAADGRRRRRRTVGSVTLELLERALGSAPRATRESRRRDRRSWRAGPVIPNFGGGGAHAASAPTGCSAGTGCRSNWATRPGPALRSTSC